MKTNDAHIELPTSKSLSNRWLVMNYVAGGQFLLRKLSDADDTQLLQLLLNQLRRGSTNHFYCHNAGTVARFLLALLAVTPGEWTLSGDERLQQRPMAPLINALRSMKCQIECIGQEGYLPVRITGYVPQNKMTELDPTESSQYVSALLLVAPLLPNGITLTLTDRASSRPYIEMTCSVLRSAGLEATVSPNNRVYRVSELTQSCKLRQQIVEMERDWSSASYVYAAAAICPGHRLRMPGLSMTNSCQGDSVAAAIFKRLGVTTTELRSPYRPSVKSIAVEGSEPESNFEYNFIDCPDLLPAVVVTCAALGVKARLKGVRNLRIKESDRLSVLQSELGKMGGKMTITQNEVRIVPSKLHNPVDIICAHGDHRIAMAFGVLSLRFPELTVDDPDIVSKSFPSFWKQLEIIRKETGRDLLIKN